MVEKSALFTAKHENEARGPGDILELLIVPYVGHRPCSLLFKGSSPLRLGLIFSEADFPGKIILTNGLQKQYFWCIISCFPGLKNKSIVAK